MRMTTDSLLIDSPAGKLELVLDELSLTGEVKPIIGIACHPHPLYGGTFTNKVVTTVSRAFQDVGVRCVRFNFRGVGKSTGVFDEGKGEQEDVLAVMQWVKEQYPQHSIWLAGFSFGAAMAIAVANRVSPERLVTIAPPAPRFGLTVNAKIECPWLLVQGEDDDVVISEHVYQWVELQDPKPKLIKVPGAGHFFHGKLNLLREIINAQ